MASGDTLVSFTAAASIAPATNSGTFDTRNGRLVLDFDPSTVESTYFRGVLPSAYAGGTLDIKIHWMTASTSGNCRWEAQFERLEAGGPDQDSDDFQAAVAVDSAANATSGKSTLATITLTALDSAVAGDPFRLKIKRDAAHANDTINSFDVELTDVEVKEA